MREIDVACTNSAFRYCYMESIYNTNNVVNMVNRWIRFCHLASFCAARRSSAALFGRGSMLGGLGVFRCEAKLVLQDAESELVDGKVDGVCSISVSLFGIDSKLSERCELLGGLTGVEEADLAVFPAISHGKESSWNTAYEILLATASERHIPSKISPAEPVRNKLALFTLGAVDGTNKLATLILRSFKPLNAADRSAVLSDCLRTVGLGNAGSSCEFWRSKEALFWVGRVCYRATRYHQHCG